MSPPADGLRHGTQVAKILSLGENSAHPSRAAGRQRAVHGSAVVSPPRGAVPHVTASAWPRRVAAAVARDRIPAGYLLDRGADCYLDAHAI
jgi:hypothetical protein